ncbi:MAG: hypothetical protein LBI36_06305 [Oscillospiraceae bacterium]|jgi:hypothetical protein|nr:hypothetical protein [Oscillospiraceae bacterium]
MVISVREIIDGGAREPALNAISRFSCRDKDVESFLKNKALEFERRDKARTYLIYDGNKSALLGYFTLSLKALPFTENTSKNTIKSIDGFSKDIRAVGIILIGQFGKDTELAKDIDGGHLLDICIETVYAAQKIVGGRFVLLECQEIDKIVSFYERNGFKALQYDENDKYLQMVRRL